MKIRESNAQDREKYRELREALDAQSEMWGAAIGERNALGDYAVKQFDHLIEAERSKLFLAEDDGELIGFLTLETPLWQSLNRTSTLMVGVRNGHQGKGVASQLFEAAEKWASAIGIHRIELLVMHHNSAAIKLYEKLGFQPEGTRRESSFLNDSFIDELYMAKLLS